MIPSIKVYTGVFPKQYFPKCVLCVLYVFIHASRSICSCSITCVDFLSECNCIGLVLHSPVEPLTNTVSLRAFRLNLGMSNVPYRRIRFILMVLPVPTVFRCSMPLEERNYPVAKTCRQRQARSSYCTAWKTRFWSKWQSVC